MLGEGPGYRRRIRVVATDAITVVGDLEDDFHRFRVTLTHDGARVGNLVGEAIRHPWSACAEANVLLDRFRGVDLFSRTTALAAHDNPKQHCTHMFDLTSIVIPHAFHRRERRQYDAFIPEFVERRSSPRLWRDGDLALAWDTDRGTIAAAPPFDGVSMTSGFLRWAEEMLDDDQLEAAVVLRRAWDIARGRGRDLDPMETAVELAPFLPPAPCFTFQPEIVDRSRRMKGTARDFSDDPDALLRD